MYIACGSHPLLQLLITPHIPGKAASQKKVMGILNLPNELLFVVGEKLSIPDLLHLLPTCHRLSPVFTECLYNRFLQAEGEFALLQSAAKLNKTSLAEFAIKKGARMIWESEGPSGSESNLPPALHTAARYDSADVIRILFKHGAEIDALHDFETPLYVAVFWKSLKAIEVFLELGAKIQREPTHPVGVEPPTHLAARRGDLDCMKVFLKNGFDFNIRCASGKTVLHEATLAGEEMVEYLLQQEGGTKIIMAQDSNGSTPLHFVLRFQTERFEKWEGVLRLLLRYGANTEHLKTQDWRGNTPLHLAAIVRFGAEESVRMLLRHGANTDLKNAWGNTPAEEARWLGKGILYRIIMECGSKVSD